MAAKSFSRCLLIKVHAFCYFNDLDYHLVCDDNPLKGLVMFLSETTDASTSVTSQFLERYEYLTATKARSILPLQVCVFDVLPVEEC